MRGALEAALALVAGKLAEHATGGSAFAGSTGQELRITFAALHHSTTFWFELTTRRLTNGSSAWTRRRVMTLIEVRRWPGIWIITSETIMFLRVHAPPGQTDGPPLVVCETE